MARAAGSKKKRGPAPADGGKSGATGRERILASALALFEEHGYRATSVETIASRAGLAKGSVYWHFKCKEDLLVAIVDREIERVKSRLGKMFAPGEYDPAEVIAVAGDLGLWVSEGVDRIRKVVLGALFDAGGGPKARRLEQKLITRSRAAYMEAREALTEAFEKVGTPAGLDARMAATCLMACAGGLLHCVNVIDPSGATPDELTRGVRALFLGGATHGRRSRGRRTGTGGATR